MGLFSALFSSGKREREEAARLGMTVQEVTRDLPEFSGDGTVTLESDRCMRYSIPRRVSFGSTWSLLQRTKAMGATFPNDYLLSSTGPLPERLLEHLREISEEYDEELFEFEGTANDVAVYWLEWGGPEEVRALRAYLEKVAAF